MNNSNLPLYIDLDGTLIKTDIAQELLVQTAASPRNWGNLFKAAASGRAQLKHLLANRASFDPATLPYNEAVVDYAQEAKAAGRRVILASATDQIIAEKIADHLKIFDGVIASHSGQNLKGTQKLKAIIGDGGDHFEYIGDSSADNPIWKAATKRGFVNAPVAARHFQGTGKQTSLQLSEKSPITKTVLRAMRPHQWAKNALILLPLFFSHRYGQPELVAKALLAVLIFSLCASAIYILNDLLDIESDRQHATKKLRPFAAGDLSPLAGISVSIALLVGSVLSSILAFSWQLTAMFGIYILATSLYSVWLKHKAIVDVTVLTCLYTLRIFVGGIAIDVPLSPWLLNFSLFFFASLALMKRYTEMHRTVASGRINSRGYYASDLSALLSMGIGSAGLSVLTLTLYLNSDHVAGVYGAPQILWLIAPVILFWIYRAWLLAQRDEMNDDPVLFALKDRISRITLAFTVGLIIAAKFLTLEGYIL